MARTEPVSFSFLSRTRNENNDRFVINEEDKELAIAIELSLREERARALEVLLSGPTHFIEASALDAYEKRATELQKMYIEAHTHFEVLLEDAGRIN